MELQLLKVPSSRSCQSRSGFMYQCYAPTSPHQSEVGIRAGIWQVTLTPPMGHLIFPYTIFQGIRLKSGQIPTLIPTPLWWGEVGNNIDRWIIVACPKILQYKKFCNAKKKKEKGIIYWLKEQYYTNWKVCICLVTFILLQDMASEVKCRCTHWLKLQTQARIFQMDVLTSRAVRCGATDQKFDCGFILKND